jgi:hypothetical protein
MPLDVHWKARLVVLGLLGAADVGGWSFLLPGNRVPYEIDTHEAVSGFTEGAPVEMLGVEIGTARRIRLATPRTVHIVLGIDRDVPITRRPPSSPRALHTLVEGVLVTVGQRAAAKGLMLRSDIAPDVPTRVHADQWRDAIVAFQTPCDAYSAN